MDTSDPALAALHPLVADWLLRRRGPPTAVQVQAWPSIAGGRHVLAVAPTGSGKTLAACLLGLQNLLTGLWPAGELSLLYVSPLKALGADVQRNLLDPLADLRPLLASHGLHPPEVRVALRTGDTPAKERAAMQRHPPEILVTTPESLHLLLMSDGGRKLLATTRQVVLDEIHAVARSPRGALLLSALEELEDLLPAPLQRVALSATLQDPRQAADEVLGPQRPIQTLDLLAPATAKAIELQSVAVPLDDVPEPGAREPGWWPAATRVVHRELQPARSALVFGSGRRSVERLARELNTLENEPIAWAHHGSLAQELRRSVEQRLKAGELRAVCATSSLELGIDVGAVDRVVLVGAPMTVSSTLQRIGRAGHAVGATSIGRLVPLYGRDILYAAVLPLLVAEGRLEPLPPQVPPLDVLAQVVVARCVARPRWPDELFDQVRRSAPFAQLERADFDDVVAMLLGRFDGLRLRELLPRLQKDASGRLEVRKGAQLAARRSAGVIADRGYFRIEIQGERTQLGELDEEFVWERRTGDVFAIGAQAWQVASIGRDAVEVVPSPRKLAMAPFWRADARDRSAQMANAVLDLMELLEPQLDDPQAVGELTARGVDADLGEQVLELLRTQRAATGGLPTHQRTLVELCRVPNEPTGYAIWHTGWGGALTRPLAIALTAYLQARHAELGGASGLAQRPPLVNDDAVLLLCEDGEAAVQAIQAFLTEDWRHWLERGLGDSALLGARFRESAGTALLLPRPPPGKRVPLWQTRERSKQLLQAVARTQDFVLLRHARRSLCQERFDLDGLGERMASLAAGTIALHVATTGKPSPLANGVLWLATGTMVYEDDAPLPLDFDGALSEVARSSQRPPLDPDVLAQLRGRWMHTSAPFGAANAEELADIAAQLSPVSRQELRALLAAVPLEQADPIGQGAGPLVPAEVVELAPDRFCHTEDAPMLAELEQVAAGDPRLRAGLLRWLAPRVVATWAELARAWGRNELDVRQALEPAVLQGEVVLGVAVAGQPTEFLATTSSLEQLLRAMRRARTARPTLRPAPDVVLLRASLNGLLKPGRGPGAVEQALDSLQGLTVPAQLWETALLPARVRDYRPADLDSALAAGDFRYFGGEGPERLGFSRADLLPLWGAVPADPELERWMPDADAGYRFDVLRARSGLSDTALSERLWHGLWTAQLAGSEPASLRRGLQLNFVLPSSPKRPSGGGWRLRAGSEAGPWPGPWWRRIAATPTDAVERAEMQTERVRQVAQRWGLLGSGLLEGEPKWLAWRELRGAALRLDWAGELRAGAWFSGLGGWQLLTEAGERHLAELDQHHETLWSCNAADPASPCGLPPACVAHLPLPPRSSANWLVWQGSTPLAVARRDGRSLELHIAPSDSRAPAVLALLLTTLARLPKRTVRIEDIDGEPAYRSAWRPFVENLGWVADFRDLVLP